MAYTLPTKIKQQACQHQFKTKKIPGSRTPIEVCIICNHRRKTLTKNETLTKYFDPASEQTKLYGEPIKFQEYVTKDEKSQQRMTIKKFVETQQLHTNWMSLEHDGFRPPATKDPHTWCGEWSRTGCLDAVNHKKCGYGNTIYARQFKRSCYRPDCTVCYYQWIIRQADRSARRIKEYQKRCGRPPFHLIASVSVSDRALPYKEQKKKLNCIVKELGLLGASVIYHPFALARPERKRFVHRSHFHLVCFGDIRGKLGLVGRKYGWYLKYKGLRNSVFQTFCYLLSHAGIKKGQRSIVWLGKLSYVKLPLEKEPDFNVCPCCMVKLVPIHYIGTAQVIPPDEYFQGFIDPGGWCEVKHWEVPIGSYEYAPIGHVNDILKGIATAS